MKFSFSKSVFNVIACLRLILFKVKVWLLYTGLMGVTTVLVVFFLYLPEKFKVFDKKLVHHRVEVEECVVSKWMESYVCVLKYRVIRLLKLLLPHISAVYKSLTSWDVKLWPRMKSKGNEGINTNVEGKRVKFWRINL